MANWVHVGQEAALGHPKGRPGLLIYGVAMWLAVTAAFETALVVQFSAPIWWVAFGALGLVTAFGMVSRMPWAYIAAILLTGRQVVGFVRAVEGGVPVIFMVQAAIAVLIMFYLLEGDRPNLIYRHRYRKYSEDAE